MEAFKRTLIAAKSIAYIDPASGAPGSIYLARLFDSLALPPCLLEASYSAQAALKAVAAGDIELGLSQKTVILASPGVELVAPLPADIQNYLTFVATVATGSRIRRGRRHLLIPVAASRLGITSEGVRLEALNRRAFVAAACSIFAQQ